MAGCVTPGDGEIPAIPAAGRTGGTRGARLLDAGGVLLSLVLLLLVWQGVSLLVSEKVMPSPFATARALAEALPKPQIWSDIGVTLGRILSAFALAMAAGIAFGCALGAVHWFRRIFNLWVILAASTPSILYIVVIYLALGLTEAAAIVGGALVVAPIITFNVWQGMRSLDPGLSEMARAFGVPRWVIFRRVLFPQTLPFLFAAARLGLTITWKIMIFIELLGRSSGVGYRIQQWYELFNMQQVLVSALPFLGVMLLIEVAVLRTLERRLFRWVREEAR